MGLTHSILIGDDIAYSLHSISIMLKQLGFTNILTATNAAEAVRTFKIKKPSIVIMDIKGMDCYYEPVQKVIDTFEAITMMQEIDSKIAYIIITASPERKFVEAAIKCRVDGILVKGFTKEKLMETIDRVMYLLQD